MGVSTGRTSGLTIAKLLVCSAGLAGLLAGVGVRPAAAEVSSVSGSAFGYRTELGILGGARTIKGAGEPGVTPSSVSYSPVVRLPAGGSASPVTAHDPDGAKGQYGPAVIFGGQWPADVDSPQPSGPLSVSTQGTAGGASVTSNAAVFLHPTPIPVQCYEEPDGSTNCAAPGGMGPGPLIADEAQSTCTANESGVSGSATFVNGKVETKYDVASGLASVTELIPDNPPPNYTVSGTIDTVGDHFTIVFNEQVIGPDSITVNAAHMYLLGANARGESIVGSSTCALTSSVANGTPVAGDDSFSTDENSPLTVSAAGLLANDSDPDGNPLSAATAQPVFVPGPNDPVSTTGNTHTFPSDPAHGTVTVNSDGSFTYTPEAYFHGTDTFAYVARDARGANDTGQVTINVSSVPGAPVAGDDSYRVIENHPLTVPAPGVLGNDVEGDGDPMTAGSATDPAHGTVTLNPNGAFTYTPDQNFVGDDSFTYTVSDGTGLSDTGLVSLLVHVDEATILKDLNLGAGSSSPSGFTELGGSVCFLAANNPATNGLWKTDGTPAGTVRLANLTPVADPAPVVMNGLMYFSATDANGISGRELWRTDGTTAGTVMVKNIRAGASSSEPSHLTAIGNTLYFNADDGTGAGIELWKTDGTQSGTLMVKDVNPGPGDGGGGGFTQVGDSVLFTGNDGVHDYELWRTDGTEAGTMMLKDFHPTDHGNPGPFHAIGGTVFFSAAAPATGRELWKSDGTAAGTVLVKDINPGPANGTPNDTGHDGTFTVFEGKMLFAATDGNLDPGFGLELWKSDGTAAGTELIRDINLGPAASSFPHNLTVAGDAVYFSANKGTAYEDFEVWKTDGSDLGTLPVKNTDPGEDTWGIPTADNFVAVNGTVYFTAPGGGQGVELWKSDGTGPGTFIAKDIHPGANSSSPKWLTPALGTMFFSVGTPTSGIEPWRLTPPQVAPTAVDDAYRTLRGTPLAVPAPGVLGNDIDGNGDAITASSASNPGNGTVTLNPDGSFTYTPDPGFVGADSFTYAAADGDGATATAMVTIVVWEDAAELVADLVPGSSPSTPTRFTQLGDTVYFLATGNGHPMFGGDGVGNGLWKTDGTAAGTLLVKDLIPIGGPVVLGDTMYFVAEAKDGSTGRELWRSDGTAAGTVIVKEIIPGTGGSISGALTLVGSTLYFAGINGGDGIELWRSDGTEAGTVLVKDISPGTGSSIPSGFTAAGSTLYFMATDGATGRELWKSDGTEAGTVLVTDINPGPGNSDPSNGVVVGTTVYFAASNGTTAGANGRELWKTDGTQAGTVMVKDINVGTNSSSPSNLIVFGDRLLFRASNGDTTGGELWVSDGTTGGTVLVKDINPGPTGSSPTELTAYDGDVYFRATSSEGVELWKTDATSAGTVLVNDINPGTASSSPGGFAVVGDTMYFSANNGVHGTELWSTDRTAAGTFMVEDIELGTASSSPASLTPGLGTMFFSASTTAHGSELWRLIPQLNEPPLAVDDTYVTTAGSPAMVAAPGVLGNDTDVDGDTVTAGSASDPANGAVTLNSDGSFTYTPDGAGFSGTDSFTYEASDGQGGSDTATVTITVTPDAAPTSLGVSNVVVVEGAAGTTSATYTVTRSGNASGSSTVKYKTAGGTATAGSDYTAVSTLTTLSFAPFETSKTVTVDVAGDTVPEKDETFNLVLSAPTGAVIADTTGAATIVNDDGTASVSVDNVTVNEGAPATFTLTRSGNTDGTSTAKYRTTGGNATAGADYSPVALTDVTFNPDETTKTVVVPVADDATAENNETFNLVLSAPSAGTVLTDTSGTATIVDDEGPVTPGPATFLSVDSVSVTEGNTGTAAATFTVTRTGTTTGPSTVKYKTSGGTATAGTDYTAPTPLTILSFAGGEATKTVTIDVTGDTLPEKDETFNLVLSAPTGATIADASGTATIVNDDGAAYLSVGNVSVTEGNTGIATATLTITRSGNTTGETTVKYKTADGTAKAAGGDYIAVTLTTITFAPGETTKTVTVDITGDTTIEKNETFNLVLSAPAGATITDAAGTTTITNDD